VTVAGNSIGGWIAAEMALARSPRISSIVIIDAVGIEVPGHPVADFFSLTFPQIAEPSYHEKRRERDLAFSCTSRAMLVARWRGFSRRATGARSLASGFRLGLAKCDLLIRKSAFDLGGWVLSRVLSVPSRRHFPGEE
jgi:pimeloyl-ACP methyl ester carboxylesterase